MPWDLQLLSEVWKYVGSQLQPDESYRHAYTDHERIVIHLVRYQAPLDPVSFTLICSDSFDTCKAQIDQALEKSRMKSQSTDGATPPQRIHREEFTEEELGLKRENTAYIDGMACSITLVFSDEGHREGWLTNMGVFEGEYGEYHQRDYERRRDNTNLMYSASALRAPELKDVLPPTELGRAWAYLEQELRGDETFKFESCNDAQVDVVLIAPDPSKPSNRMLGFTLYTCSSFEEWKAQIDQSLSRLRE